MKVQISVGTSPLSDMECLRTLELSSKATTEHNEKKHAIMFRHPIQPRGQPDIIQVWFQALRQSSKAAHCTDIITFRWNTSLKITSTNSGDSTQAEAKRLSFVFDKSYALDLSTLPTSLSTLPQTLSSLSSLQFPNVVTRYCYDVTSRPTPPCATQRPPPSVDESDRALIWAQQEQSIGAQKGHRGQNPWNTRADTLITASALFKCKITWQETTTYSKGGWKWAVSCWNYADCCWNLHCTAVNAWSFNTELNKLNKEQKSVLNSASRESPWWILRKAFNNHREIFHTEETKRGT